MTWILPKQLHTLDCVRDTEALSLDLAEQSQICAQSLFVRSKLSQSQIWSQKWKRDSWTQHLYGRILKPSLGQSFVDEWTSLLEATRANHSQQEASEQDQTIQDTCGHLLQMELLQCDQVFVSLKTSKDISRWGCPTLSKTWQEWVIERRGEYFQRVKSAHLTNANGSSSWPTIRASEYKDTGSIGSKSHDHMLGKGYLCAVVTQDAHGQAAPVNPSTDGSRPELLGTPRCSMAQDKQEDMGKHRLGEQAQHNTNGKLNPRWVETLMGLPVGWVMPSCASPVIIEPTNCDYSAMESCQPPPSEPSELF
jgi:hypothetical protein